MFGLIFKSDANQVRAAMFMLVLLWVISKLA